MHLYSYKQTYIALIIATFLWLMGVSPAVADKISVNAAVDNTNVYAGEPFRLQIQVEGNDTPNKPNLSALTAFQVQSLGGQQNSSSSITIINGKMNRISHHGYLFNYQLTAKTPGRHTIPSIPVQIDGKIYRTGSISILARKPQETNEFKLRLQPQKTRLYLGEPTTLVITWYIGMDVKDFSFTLPLLDDDKFTVIIPDVKVTKGQEDNYLLIEVGQHKIIAKKEQQKLNGRDFLAVTFDLTLLAKQTGQITLPQVTVSAKALSGYSRQRFRDPMNNFFNDDRFSDFFGGQRGVYSSVVVPSNQPQLTILPLPEKNKPANFNGLVGTYSIATEATPTEVNVGDPITLSIMVTGPDYLDNVRLPALASLPGFSGQFKIPDEIAAGEIDGHKKVFTQTIRAQKDTVTAIPPVTLSFFNTETNRYETAGADPIKIKVHPTTIITARDAIGGGTANSSPQQKTITEQEGGIFSNYEGAELIERKMPRREYLTVTAGRLLILLLPPCLFLFIGGAFILYQRRDPNQIAKTKALSQFKRHCIQTDIYGLGEAIRTFLQIKLDLPPGALTFKDIEPHLRQAGIEDNFLNRLNRLLQTCEAGRYGGDIAGSISIEELQNTASSLLTALDKKL